jgi:hypothetical protein
MTARARRATVVSLVMLAVGVLVGSIPFAA